MTCKYINKIVCLQTYVDAEVEWKKNGDIKRMVLTGLSQDLYSTTFHATYSQNEPQDNTPDFYV